LDPKSAIVDKPGESVMKKRKRQAMKCKKFEAVMALICIHRLLSVSVKKAGSLESTERTL
jgi:hypothetical protein